MLSTRTHNKLTITLGTLVATLVVLSGWLLWSYECLQLEAAFASEQIEIFEEMRTRALQSDVAGAAGCLQYAVTYYPSGTKQRAGSWLDQMVERERARVAREIVAYLRAQPGQDLGESPEAWIRKYAGR